MIGRGYLTEDGAGLRLTDTGQTEVDLIQASWRRWLDTKLDDWDCADPADRALLDQALENIAAKLLDEETREREPVRA
ncbi:hypothetical protein OIE68_38500 [Nocardia vinacea]|uniref:HTH marR-type domain-containing protein n=1 Tax=Nocardia vinacea TaxID=96468 RepID=A0ABZ1YKP9_9NOCA|nr:hypothetical protein OIE68_38500 [Nocardia vinacea]